MSLRSSGLLRFALPHIERVRETWGLGGRLGVVWRGQVSFLYHSDGGRGLIDSIAGARPWPAARSAIGRVVLARLDDEEVRALVGDTLPEAEWSVLMAVIRSIRSQGYLLYPGSTIAMAIGDPPTSALAFRGSTITEDNEALIDDVRTAVRAISERLESGQNHSGSPDRAVAGQ